MALLLDRQLTSGVNVQYYKIIRVDMNFLTNMCSFTLGYYLNKAVKDASMDPVYTEGYNINIDPGTDIRASIYSYLKTLPDYKNSKDV